MKNKSRRKIFELEQEIEEVKLFDDCMCMYIQMLNERISKHKGIQISEDLVSVNYTEEQLANLEFHSICPDCGKPYTPWMA
jgi:hypothetical protein